MGQEQARNTNDSAQEETDFNPNRDDLPEPAARREAPRGTEPNVWWSEWANDELRLQQMRPANLPGGILQSPRHGTGTSDGVGAAGGTMRAEGFSQLSNSLASSREESYEAEITAAATEMARQTSISHYQLDLAEMFLRGDAEARRQEPEYFNIGTPVAAPEGGDFHGVYGGERRQDGAHLVGSDNRTGPRVGERRQDGAHLVSSDNRTGPRMDGLASSGDLDLRGQSLQGLGLQTVAQQGRITASAARGALEQGEESARDGMEHLRSMPTSEMYRMLGAEVENQPLLQILFQRLELAEARSRSTTSFQSVTDQVGYVQSRQESERQIAGMCLTPPTGMEGRGVYGFEGRGAYGFEGRPGLPSQLPSSLADTSLAQLQQHSLDSAGACVSRQSGLRGRSVSQASAMQPVTTRDPMPSDAIVPQGRPNWDSGSGTPLQFGFGLQQPPPPRSLTSESSALHGPQQQQVQSRCSVQAEALARQEVEPQREQHVRSQAMGVSKHLRTEQPQGSQYYRPPGIPQQSYQVKAQSSSYGIESPLQFGFGLQQPPPLRSHVTGPPMQYSISSQQTPEVPRAVIGIPELPGSSTAGLTPGIDATQDFAAWLGEERPTACQVGSGTQMTPVGQRTLMGPTPTVDLLDIDPFPVARQEARLNSPGIPMFGYPENPNQPRPPPPPKNPKLLTEAPDAMSLSQILSADAGQSSPFAACTRGETLAANPCSPRTPKVGTSSMYGYTPGGTKVPEGPPPPTPPRNQGSQVCGSPNVGTLGPTYNAATPSSPGPVPIPVPPRPPYELSGRSVEGPARSEEPSRLVMSLPHLDVSEGGTDASVTTGDWIARIGPVMRSLSPGASGWWATVMSTAEAYYHRWLQADPLQRLGIKSEAISHHQDYGSLSRVEERGSVLVLQALPGELQSEAVSTRALNCASLLFLTMSRFQPGGSAEKASILAYLTQPQTEGPVGVVTNHAALRKWERLFRRCKELGLQIPDPSLLVRGLDTLGKIIGNKSPTAGWRLYSFRHQHHLDVQPSEQTVLSYCQLLTAELETLALAQDAQKQQRVATMQAETPKGPRECPSKAASKVPSPKQPHHPKTSSPKQPSGPLDDRGICKFFSSPHGCRYGRACVHPHEQLHPNDGKCFNCGATGHSMQECDKPTKPAAKASARQSGQDGPAVFAPPPAPKTPNPHPKRKPKGRKLETAADGAAVSGESATFESEENIEKMLKKAACVVGDPHMIATLNGISVGKTRGLLDGGATHSLRHAAPSEYRMARPVQVHLASGSTFDLRMNAVGTLLSEDPEVQPIVPMGLLAEELGCIISWKGKECQVVHPETGKLNVTVSRGCPEVPHDVCLSLILELEEKRSSSMLGDVRRAQIATVMPDTKYVQRFEEVLQRLQEKVDAWFPAVPADLRSKLLPRHAYTPAASGLNRHCRRKLERGNALIHLFAGKQKHQHPSRIPAAYLDLLSGHDLRDDALFAYLLQLAVRGNIQFLLAGPPCRTVSALRQRGSGEHSDGGPGIVRTRSGDERFGLRGLEEGLQQVVEGDTLLILRTVLLAEVSNEGLEAVRAAEGPAVSKPNGRKGWSLFFGMEHPEDPLEYLSKGQVKNPEQVPTIWEWKEIKDFVQRNGLYEASFHQGMLGHQAVKPTKVITSSGYLWERLHLLKVPKGELWSPSAASTLQGRLQQSSSWAQWAPQLVSFFKDSMEDWLLGPEHCEQQDRIRRASLEQLRASNAAVPSCQSLPEGSQCERA